MKLRHFLYGKDSATDDFLTLVKSSEMTKPELKYWEMRVGVLIRELRDYGVPGDFMRLFISGQGIDKWAYVRARTGGDRSRFDFQAIMLNSEELNRLGWQPWALDRVLFSGNTHDQRVQDALQRSASGYTDNLRIVDLEFDEREIQSPRLTMHQEEMVDRIVAGLESTNSTDTRWYFDEGQVGEEKGRQIIAGVLGRMHDMNRKVPGFVMGITSIRESSATFRVSRQSDGRFSDIRLASYRKSLGGSFPFENWRDAEMEQSTATFTERRPQRSPNTGTAQPDDDIFPTSNVELEAQDALPASFIPAMTASEDHAQPRHSPARSFDAAGDERASNKSQTGLMAKAMNAWDGHRSRLPPGFNVSADVNLWERFRNGLERTVPLKLALLAMLLILACSNVLTYSLSQMTKAAAIDLQADTAENRNIQSADGQKEIILAETEHSPETFGKNSSVDESRNIAAGESDAAVPQYVASKVPDSIINELESVNASKEEWIVAYRKLERAFHQLGVENHQLRMENQTMHARTQRRPRVPAKNVNTANPPLPGQEVGTPKPGSNEPIRTVNPNSPSAPSKDQKKNEPPPNPTRGTGATPPPSAPIEN